MPINFYRPFFIAIETFFKKYLQLYLIKTFKLNLLITEIIFGGKAMLKLILFKKGFVIGTAILFLGTSIIPLAKSR